MVCGSIRIGRHNKEVPPIRVLRRAGRDKERAFLDDQARASSRLQGRKKLINVALLCNKLRLSLRVGVADGG